MLFIRPRETHGIRLIEKEDGAVEGKYLPSCTELCRHSETFFGPYNDVGDKARAKWDDQLSNWPRDALAAHASVDEARPRASCKSFTVKQR